MRTVAETRPSLAIGLLVGAAIILLVGDFFPAAAQSERTDLIEVRAEITRMRKKLQRVRRQARGTEQELQTIELQTAILSRELDVALEIARELERQRIQAQTEIARLTHRIGLQKKYLAARLAALYRLGSLSYLRILLSLDEHKNPFEAAAMLSYLINRDARAVKQFQQSQADLAEQQSLLAEKQLNIAESRREVSARSAALQRARSSKTTLLARLQIQSSESEQKIADLEEKARRLERLFQLLYEQARGGDSFTARIGEFKGALQWPVEGNVVEGFGPKRSARFATVTVSNGLKIEAAPGTDVHAVFEGTVVFSQWFKGYGNLVILDHGNRIFSLYGNTRGTTLGAGEKVAPGQVVGQVAEDEDGPSGYLYFEIREDNEPVDPVTWLR